MKEAFEKIKERLEHIKEEGVLCEGCTYDCAEGGCESRVCDNAIEIVNQVAEEYGDDFCEWFKYDYRTIAPKNHDVGNPYWRIPEDYSKLMFCPYCGKKIKVVK